MYYGDLHIHTSYSDGLDDPLIILKHSIKRGLKIIAVTDHDTNHGYFRITATYGKKQLKKMNLVVIPGIELSSSIGHILVLGIDTPISIDGRALRNREGVIDFIERLRDRLNALVVFAHPYSCRGVLACPGVKDRDLLKTIDAIEVINGRTMPKRNISALRLAKEYNKVYVAGSDAHRFSEVGTTYTIFQNAIQDEDEALDHIRRGLVRVGPIPDLIPILKGIISRRIYSSLNSLRTR